MRGPRGAGQPILLLPSAAPVPIIPSHTAGMRALVITCAAAAAASTMRRQLRLKPRMQASLREERSLGFRLRDTEAGFAGPQSVDRHAMAIDFHGGVGRGLDVVEGEFPAEAAAAELAAAGASGQDAWGRRCGFALDVGAVVGVVAGVCVGDWGRVCEEGG